MQTYTLPQLKSKEYFNMWMRGVKEEHGMEGLVDQTWELFKKVIPVLVDDPDSTERPEVKWSGRLDK